MRSERRRACAAVLTNRLARFQSGLLPQGERIKLRLNYGKVLDLDK
jgi:hypothetical protein